MRIWRRYATCSGAACHAPLAPDLRLTPAENQALTEAQLAAGIEYYG